jgi:two-component system, NarL family, invasion response regulator UvrY
MIRLLIVDDHPLVRMGVRTALQSATDIDIVGEAGTGAEAMEVIAVRPLDVVLLDVSMPGRHGVEILRRLVNEYPELAVLIYTRFPEEQYAVRTLRAGAAGYVSKSAAPDELIQAIHTVAAGETYLSAKAATLIKRALVDGAGTLQDSLSDREDQIMRLLVAGQSVSAIAEGLSISIKTVSTHRMRLMKKLGVDSLADLVHYAIENGLNDRGE